MSSNNDDLIAGWRYLVTLQLSTPLAYLERDGEYSPGFKEPSLVGTLAATHDDFMEAIKETVRATTDEKRLLLHK